MKKTSNFKEAVILNKVFIWFVFIFLVHCIPQHSTPVTQQKDTPSTGDDKKKTTPAKNSNKKQSTTNKNSLSFINNTNEPLWVIYQGSPYKKQSMQQGDCFSFRKTDLRDLEFNPTICSWYCPRDLMGCRNCPSQNGYYEFLQRSKPYDPLYKKISDTAPDEEDCSIFPP